MKSIAERKENWKAKQKELESSRYWSDTVEFALRLGQVGAIDVCKPRVKGKLAWRKIDRATENLRALLGIGGRAWEPLPEIQIPRRNSRMPKANGLPQRNGFSRVSADGRIRDALANPEETTG